MKNPNAGMTKKLLDWNNVLTKQADQRTGSTPLHIAISWGSQSKDVIKLLLDQDESSAFQSDNSGSFPIHVAAMRKSWSTIHILLKKAPRCAELCDAQGQTFLHVAIKNERPSIFGRWHNHTSFASILNVQDNDGNTPLHVAAMVGNQWSFYLLIHNPQVQLDLVNNKGQTPLDIAWMMIPQGLNFVLVIHQSNSSIMVFESIVFC
jgi:ankyrin repeat protein